MALTVPQNLGTDSTANANTVAQSTSATAAGSLLVVLVENENSLLTTGVTDNLGQIYSQVPGSAASHSAGATRIDAWDCLGTASGVTTVTATFGGAAGTYRKQIWFFEFAGLTLAVRDGAASVSNGASAGGFITGANVNTSGAVGFLVGLDASSAGATSNPSVGNEFSAGVNVFGNCSVYLISTMAAGHQPVWTDAGAAFASLTAAWREGFRGTLPLNRPMSMPLRMS